MTTYGNLIEEIVSNLQGFTVSPDQKTYITEAVADGTQTVIHVADASQLSRGYAEIDTELVDIVSKDSTANTVTVLPMGRGQRGTTATTHVVNSTITMSPSWPKSTVAREINNVLTSLYPRLFAVKAAPLITADATTYQWGVPADCEAVLDVNWKFTTIDGWQRAKSWEIQNSAPAEFLTGIFLNIFDGVPPGSSMQVLYAARFAPLVNVADVLKTVSGMEDGDKDILILGVMAKMIQFAELARLPLRSVGANTAAQNNPVGIAAQLSQSMKRDFEARVLQAQAAQARKYPTRVHRTR